MQDTTNNSIAMEARIEQLSEEADRLASQKDFDGALLKFSTARALLPESLVTTPTSFRLYTSIGDVYRLKGDLIQARANYMYALQLSDWEEN